MAMRCFCRPKDAGEHIAAVGRDPTASMSASAALRASVRESPFLAALGAAAALALAWLRSGPGAEASRPARPSTIRAEGRWRRSGAPTSSSHQMAGTIVFLAVKDPSRK